MVHQFAILSTNMQATIPSTISLGQASALLQRSPSEIADAAERLGIAPAYRENFKAFYHEQDITGPIREHLAGKQGGKH